MSREGSNLAIRGAILSAKLDKLSSNDPLENDIWNVGLFVLNQSLEPRLGRVFLAFSVLQTTVADMFFPEDKFQCK